MLRAACWVLALCLSASSAGAVESGVGVSWDDCGAAGRESRLFACDRNEGPDTVHQLFFSFVLPAGMDSVGGVQAELQFSTWDGRGHGPGSPPPDPLPPWWQLRNEAASGQVNQCRHGALSLSWTPSPAGLAACVDIWQGRSAAGGLGRYAMGWYGGAKLNMVVAVPYDQSFRLEPGVEYFAFRLLIDSRKTIGSPSCPGCETRVFIRDAEIEVWRPYPSPSFRLSYPLHWDYVTWQDAPTPARRETWGGIKALYR
jgi:hypothetical protein